MSNDRDIIDGEIVDGTAEPEPEREYEIVIADQAFTDDHCWLNVQFTVPDAPKMPWSKAKYVVLGVTIPCTRDPRFQLTSGSPQPQPQAGYRTPAAISRYDEQAAAVAGMTRSERWEAQVPTTPSDDVILAACQAELRRYLKRQREEAARHEVREKTDEQLIGRTFKVRA